ncbi:MAG TPA: YraN family protein [Patescibacteria group bacterium]
MKVGNSLGQYGETMAAKWLHKQGFHIEEMNFRKNYTEIDIIATKDNTLIFFEVKTRISEDFGKPFEAITREKIHNIVQTAQLYSFLHPKLPKSLRIDAIGVTLDKHRNILDIEHVENISGF